MKWLKVLVALLEIFIPGLGKLGMNDLNDELKIANKTIHLMSNNMGPEEKGHFIEQAIGSLKGVQNYKKRIAKKLDKAKARLYKKLF